jgi:hypothetical protein
MNVLPFDKQVAIISALTEGCSVRTTERLTGVHRDTIMRLAARVALAQSSFTTALFTASKSHAPSCRPGLSTKGKLQ